MGYTSHIMLWAARFFFMFRIQPPLKQTLSHLTLTKLLKISFSLGSLKENV